MICRKCRTYNPESAAYCSSCGKPLIRNLKTNKKHARWLVIVAGLGILLAGGYFIIRMTEQSSLKEKSPQAENVAEIFPTISSDIPGAPLIIGGVVIKDLGGKEISGLSTVVWNGRWIAAPVWSLLKGNSLVFHTAESGEIPITEGYWTSGDPLMLMKLKDDPGGDTPKLSSWAQYKSVDWFPFLKQDSGIQVDIPRAERIGSFFSFRLPDEIRQPGVFMQEGKVVGWAFPDWMDKGYLWADPGDTGPIPTTTIERFLHSVLPSWREAHFDYVLNEGKNLPAANRLEALAEGLRMHSLFLEQDVPYQLRPRAIVEQMHLLAGTLMDMDLAKEVVQVLDEKTIAEFPQLILIKDAVLARLRTEDYHKAIRFLEKVKKHIYTQKGEKVPGVDPFHSQLYKDWLRKILDQGGYFSGMAAFEEAKRLFPEDLELHLLGVEVAVKDKNWTKARELLQMRDYPESMREWVGELETKIQEVQENEGAVTIRFSPGTTHIPVRVYLNGSHAFRFILDTGATMCSVPSSAVDRLRIDIDQRTPVRLVSTAGGIAEVYEIKLNSIELEGFRVFNVNALVIDIPGYEDYGLLGQNFLNYFHIEIDNQKGILRLKKR